MSTVRDSLCRSPLLELQLGWLELVEAGLHVVGAVVVMGWMGASPRTTRVRVAPVRLDTHWFYPRCPTDYNAWYHLLPPLCDYNAIKFFKIVRDYKVSLIYYLNSSEYFSFLSLSQCTLFSHSTCTLLSLSLPMHVRIIGACTPWSK
jgi:hypothetical protein